MGSGSGFGSGFGCGFVGGEFVQAKGDEDLVVAADFGEAFLLIA